jgi:hypothetical protein
MDTQIGNILGAPEAELDQLLGRVFVETGDYRALTQSTDYNFVVERRGTGKSELLPASALALQPGFAQQKIAFHHNPAELLVKFRQHTLAMLIARSQMIGEYPGCCLSRAFFPA